MNRPLDPVLVQHLRRVPAPPELWYHVHRPSPQCAGTPSRRRLWLALATVGPIAIAAFALTILVPRAANRNDNVLRALARGPDDLELRSDGVAEIRSWVKTRLGIDIPLPEKTADTVRLTGACAVRGETPTIEIDYRVGTHKAALLVSKAALGIRQETPHHAMRCESIDGTRVSSWTMRGQAYTLAFATSGTSPAAQRPECLLCHFGSEPGI